MFGWGVDIGIDLGTASVLVFVKDQGIVLNEPSVVAIDKKTGQIFAVGEEARKMLGRTPGNIVAIRPLKEGVIADYESTERMLRYFIEKACGKSFFFKPRVMVCIPSGITGVEERAVREAAMQAGARQAYLIEEPMAAALGAGLEIADANGTMVIDIGGGTTDIAVLSLGGIVISKSLRIGGDKFDEAIVRHIRREHNMMVGERSAEELKITIGTAYPESSRAKTTMSIRGRNLVTGLPKSIILSGKEVSEAIKEPIEAIIGGVREILEKTPPELVSDIIDKGVVLTGGGAMLHGLDELLTMETGLPIHLADDPIACVAIGTGKALQMLDVLKESGMVSKGLV